MRLCFYEECEHYSKATKYPRKCFYEPQCWRGYLDIVIEMIELKLPKKLKRKKVGGNRGT